jgi:hypothetical protein
MWFCSSGLGPGPSGGVGEISVNGSAGPASKIRKKTLTESIVIVVYGISAPSRSRFQKTTSADNRVSTHAQKRIEPSSAPHNEMIV